MDQRGDVTLTVSLQPAPHVFVVPGDLTRLAADAWLLPTDARLAIERYWEDAVPGVRARVASAGAALTDFRAGRVRGLAIDDGDGPAPVLTQVPLAGLNDAARIVAPFAPLAPLADALGAAPPAARNRAAKRAAITCRGWPLAAMPLLRARGGEGNRFRDMVRRRVPSARQRAVIESLARSKGGVLRGKEVVQPD